MRPRIAALLMLIALLCACGRVGPPVRSRSTAPASASAAGEPQAAESADSQREGAASDGAESLDTDEENPS